MPSSENNYSPRHHTISQINERDRRFSELERKFDLVISKLYKEIISDRQKFQEVISRLYKEKKEMEQRYESLIGDVPFSKLSLFKKVVQDDRQNFQEVIQGHTNSIEKMKKDILFLMSKFSDVV